MAAGGSNFTINFKAATAEIRKAAKELKNLHKEFQKSSKELNKLQGGMHKERLKEMQQLRKTHQTMVREQQRSFKSLTKDKERVHKQEIQNLKKSQQLQQRERREQEQHQRRQDRRQREQARQLRRPTAGGIARAGASVAGMAGGFLLGAAQSAYAKYMEYGQARGQTIGLAPGRVLNRGINRAMGTSLGFSLIDTAQQQRAMARATGQVGPRELQQAMRAYGLDVGEASNLFGTIRQAGYGFGGAGKGKQSSGAREFQKIMEMGIASGLERGRLPEYMEGVQNIMSKQANIATGVLDPGGIARQLTMLGQTGLPGFQGARGANVLQRLHGAFTKPGGGEFGENFMRMAMGFGKGTSFYEAEKRREQGITGKGNLQRLLGEVSGQFGTGQEGALALREIAGVSLDQAEQLLKLQESGATSEEKLAVISKIAEESQPMEKQSLEAMKGVGHGVKRIATLTNRGIAIGAKVAPYIEKMEDLQYQLLKTLMGLAQDVKEIYNFIKEWFMAGGAEAGKKAVAAYIQREKEAVTGKSMDQVIAEREAKRRQQKSAMQKATQGSGPNTSSWTSAVWGAGKSLIRGETGKDWHESSVATRKSNYAGQAATKAEQQLKDWRIQAGVSLSAPVTPEENDYRARMIDSAMGYHGQSGSLTGAENWRDLGGSTSIAAPPGIARSYAKIVKGKKKWKEVESKYMPGYESDLIAEENRRRTSINAALRRMGKSNLYQQGVQPGSVMVVDDSDGSVRFIDPGSAGYERYAVPGANIATGDEGDPLARVPVKPEDARAPSTRRSKKRTSRKGGR